MLNNVNGTDSLFKMLCFPIQYILASAYAAFLSFALLSFRMSMFAHARYAQIWDTSPQTVSGLQPHENGSFREALGCLSARYSFTIEVVIDDHESAKNGGGRVYFKTMMEIVISRRWEK